MGYLTYKKYVAGEIALFISEHCHNIDIDESTLNTTYRNEKRICALANKLYPNMKACDAMEKDESGHDGVFIVPIDRVEEYIEKYNPMQLRDKVTVSVSDKAPAMNFGNAKGLTFERVLIYPTKPIIKWLQNSEEKLEVQSRAKLYVAITRAVHSVAFVDDSKKGIAIDGAIKW